MAEQFILTSSVLLEWDSFREEVFPMREIEKVWGAFQEAGRTLPEREQRNRKELNEFVLKILDSNPEERAGILSEAPTELKILLVFRLLRANDFFRSSADARGGIRLPPGANTPELIHDFFRDALIRS